SVSCAPVTQHVVPLPPQPLQRCGEDSVRYLIRLLLIIVWGARDGNGRAPTAKQRCDDVAVGPVQTHVPEPAVAYDGTMKVTIIGTGYVGLTTGTALAYLGHDVTFIDKNEAIIDKLEAGTPTIHED